MANEPATFHDLLKGIREHQLRISQQELADHVRSARSLDDPWVDPRSIRDWERGPHHPSPQSLRNLLEALGRLGVEDAQRRGLEQAWERSRRRPGRKVGDRQSDGVGGDARGSASAVDLLKYLPGSRCVGFFGRDGLLEEVECHFRVTSDPRRIVLLWAHGGYGKTETARKIAERLVESRQFAEVAWISFQAFEFNLPGTILDIAEKTPPSLDSVVAGLLEQFRCETERVLRERLRDEPLLVVIDNLESVVSDLEVVRLINHLDRLLAGGRSRAILTSRRDADLSFVKRIEMGGLDLAATTALLAHLAQDENIRALERATAEEVAQIHTITDGMPLAVFLVAKRIRRYDDVHGAIADLAEARGDTAIHNFCTYLFSQDWLGLSGAAKGLLAYLGIATATSQSRSWLDGLRLSETIRLDERALAWALAEIWERGFVLRVASADSRDETRYAMHPLARAFVLDEDVRVEWEGLFPPIGLLGQATVAHRTLVDRVVRRRAAGQSVSPEQEERLTRTIRDMLRTMDSYLDLGEPHEIVAYWAQLNGYLWLTGLYTHYLDLQRRAMTAAQKLTETSPLEGKIFTAVVNANMAFVYMELGQLAQAERCAVEAESL